MKAAMRSSVLARIFLVAGFGVAMSVSPASAQKSGGSITVGLELDIPGFDPLKVGVYDTAALTASSAIFDHFTRMCGDLHGCPSAGVRSTMEDTVTVDVTRCPNGPTAADDDRGPGPACPGAG